VHDGVHHKIQLSQVLQAIPLLQNFITSCQADRYKKTSNIYVATNEDNHVHLVK